MSRRSGGRGADDEEDAPLPQGLWPTRAPPRSAAEARPGHRACDPPPQGEEDRRPRVDGRGHPRRHALLMPTRGAPGDDDLRQEIAALVQSRYWKLLRRWLVNRRQPR